jgi:hypothetical protein
MIPAAMVLLSAALFAGACSGAPQPGPTQPTANVTRHKLVTPRQPVLNPPPPGKGKGCSRQTQGWTTAPDHHTGLGEQAEINGVTSHGSDDTAGAKRWPCYVIYTVDFTKGTDVSWQASYKGNTLWVTIVAPYNQANAGNWHPGDLISGSPTEGGLWLAGYTKVGGDPATVYTIRLDRRHQYAVNIHPPKGEFGQSPEPGYSMQLDIQIAK